MKDTAPGCLLVTSIFPPIRGGSAVVYDNLGRYGEGRVVVLAPYRHYQTGHVLVGWRDYDKSAPYPIHRIELLRPVRRQRQSRRGLDQIDRLAEAAGADDRGQLQARLQHLGFAVAELRRRDLGRAQRLNAAGAARAGLHMARQQQRCARGAVADQEVRQGLGAGMVRRRHQQPALQ